MPIQRTSAVPANVREAISVASRETGTSFEYLMNTAKRESSFKTNAKSPTSSAAGLFQFVEGTWLKVVKDEGDRLGLGEHSKYIHKTSSGQYYVPNARQRQRILALRHDAETAALVAGAYTEHNARYVAERIGREPNEAELYLAHFLGPGNAARMIELAEQSPNSSASRYFPHAARANKSIFYENGHSRSVSDVYDILVSSHLESGSGGGTRNTRYGPLDFGSMGSLMADIQASERSYQSGEGEDGSIGVWSDMVAPQHVSASNSNNNDPVLADHQKAVQRYQTAARLERESRSVQHSSTPSNNSPRPHTGWIKDAFGVD